MNIQQDNGDEAGRPRLPIAAPRASVSAPSWLPPRRAEWLALALLIAGQQLRRHAVDIGVRFGDASYEGVARATRWAEAIQQAGAACLLIAGGLMLYVLFTRRARGGGVFATLFVLWVVVGLAAFWVIIGAMAGSPIAR